MFGHTDWAVDVWTARDHPRPTAFAFPSVRPRVRPWSGPRPLPPNFAEVVPNLQSGGRGRVARLAREIQDAVLEAVQVMPRLTEGLVAFFSERVASLEPLNQLRILPFDLSPPCLFITDALDVLTFLPVTADRSSEIAFQREYLSNESKCNGALPFAEAEFCAGLRMLLL